MRFFEYESRAIVAKAGIPVTKHGFAKTAEQSVELLRRLGELAVLHCPILVGVSRKSFIGAVAGEVGDLRLVGDHQVFRRIDDGRAEVVDAAGVALPLVGELAGLGVEADAEE